MWARGLLKAELFTHHGIHQMEGNCISPHAACQKMHGLVHVGLSPSSAVGFWAGHALGDFTSPAFLSRGMGRVITAF